MCQPLDERVARAMQVLDKPAAPPAPAIDDETRRVLATAKGLIARGWCQEVYEDGSGGHCLLGAVYNAADGAMDSYRAAHNMLVDAIGPPHSLVNWNDALGRTQADVVALIDKVLAGPRS